MKRNAARVAATLLALWGALIGQSAPPVALAGSETARVAQRSALAPASLPFSLEQLINYFGEALGQAPYPLYERAYGFVQSDGRDQALMIVVSATAPNAEVVLLATGDWGVSSLREFFEAPSSAARKRNGCTPFWRRTPRPVRLCSIGFGSR